MLPTKNVKNAEQTVMDALHQFQYTYQTLRVDKKNKLVSQNQVSPAYIFINFNSMKTKYYKIYFMLSHSSQITPHRVGLLSGGGCMHDPFAIG